MSSLFIDYRIWFNKRLREQEARARPRRHPRPSYTTE